MLLLGIIGAGWFVTCPSNAAPDTSVLDAGTNVELDASVLVPAAPADPRTEKIRTLIDAQLPPDVDPQSLFDVPLGDEPAIQVEALRLRRLLEPQPPSKAPPPHASPKGTASAISATVNDAGPVDPLLVQSRDELDRARLAFFALPAERRAELLEQHAARAEASRPKETDAERNAREAEQERQKALEAAREARSAAERAVAKELARLLGVERAVTLVRADFAAQKEELITRRESLLGWQQRVHDAQLASGTEADATYDAIRKTLRAGRDDLARALDAERSGESRVPTLGSDALKEIPLEISTEEARKRRDAIGRVIERARTEERALRQERAATLLEEIDALNGDRLKLLASLSPEKRAAITGFTMIGLDQAHSEARQLLLILRYHRHVVLGWFDELRRTGRVQGMSWWRVVVVTVPWLLLVIAFLWWRRRSPKLFELADSRLAELDRGARRAVPSPLRRAVRVLRGVQRPLSWLLFLGLAISPLRASTRSLLEVQLLTVILAYSFGGALVVNLINAIATSNDQRDARSGSDLGLLRLRSLRLVGLVVVIFALELVLSARLVGIGTLYNWVRIASWFAGLPVFLILVSWWRETVFERVERSRRKTGTQRWILANRSGWKSFFAAMIAAVQVFAIGGYRTLRNWVTRFELVRRAHAYLFKRELSRLAAGKLVTQLEPLRESVAASLSPDRASRGLVDCPADAAESALRKRAAAAQGGLIAIVGRRGQGKSTVLRRLAEQLPGARSTKCHADWSVEDLRAALADRADTESAVLLDDAQALIKPIQGGLRLFDEALALAKEHSQKRLWVFAIDAALWPFLRRARDSRPLFDQVLRLEPWRDDQIGALLMLRDREADITPNFEDLLDKLPATADEIDKQEAMEEKRDGYFRMVWDYARGNPGVALEVWRASLVQDSAGAVRVRALVTPDVSALEELSDAALFIVRAILQMGPASAADVSRATRITEAQIENAFRFGRAKGYICDESGGRVHIAWRWLRAVTAVLERRHLLEDS